MSRRGLLSLLCLSVLLLSLAPLTHAVGEIKVDESRTRILIQNDPVEVQLAVENSSSESLNATIQLEMLDPQDRVVANSSSTQAISPGSQTVKLFIPFSSATLRGNERRELLWYRLRYRVNEHPSGIVSISQSPDLFELSVVMSEMAREGSTYHVRVNASHPITHKPAAKVAISGELSLEDDGNRNLKLHASKNTDSEGYALLDFVLPPRFPQFPHTLQPAGGAAVPGDGQLHGRRWGVERGRDAVRERAAPASPRSRWKDWPHHRGPRCAGSIPARGDGGRATGRPGCSSAGVRSMGSAPARGRTDPGAARRGCRRCPRSHRSRAAAPRGAAR